MPQSIQKSPTYVLHRDGVTSADSTVNSYVHGVNTSHYDKANVQVVPIGGANPNVEVLWWSDEADKFISEHVALAKAGVGANTPFEFTVECHSRVMFVAVTAIAAGSVKIFVSGAGLSHPE